MLDKSQVGEKIYSLRKKLGITQYHLAQLVSVTPQAISKWENGNALPDTYLLPRLAELFHVGIDEILCIKQDLINYKDNTSAKIVSLSGIALQNGLPSLVSCIRSSLSYLGIHVSLGWVSAPYAFNLNINETVCTKGPEYWNDKGCMDEHIRNLGGVVKKISARYNDIDIVLKRETAWNDIRDAINKGLPCYAWGMDKPQYSLISGYDKRGYYYIDSSTAQTKGPKSYLTLGEEGWGHLEAHIMRPGTISDNLKTIKDIFEFAVNLGKSDLYKPNNGYTLGVLGYQTWWESMEQGAADTAGIAENAAFWAHCKTLAVQFLTEAKLRIGLFEDVFDKAIQSYQNVAALLSKLSKLYPLSIDTENIANIEKISKAVVFLKKAMEQEIKGLEAVNEILVNIYKIW